MYGLYQATPRGRRLRLYPAQHFSGQLETDHFSSLRAAWLASADEHVVAMVAAVSRADTS